MVGRRLVVLRGLLAATVASALAAAILAGCSGGSGPSAPFDPHGNGQVGAWSARLLQASPYTSLYVEVAYVSSEQPTPQALALLQQRLTERCNKPAGVTVALGQSFTSTTSVYSIAALEQLETLHRTKFASGTEAAIFVLYVNGMSDQDTPTTRTLGLTYSGTSTAVFKDSIALSANPLVPASEIEASMLVHEAGHVLGLVNLGAPLTSAHEDTRHVHHCAVQTCVMFWEIESTSRAVLQALGGRLPDDFDPLCVADLRANGGK